MQTLLSKVSTEFKKLSNSGDHEVDGLHVSVGMVCIQLTYTHKKNYKTFVILITVLVAT